MNTHIDSIQSQSLNRYNLVYLVLATTFVVLLVLTNIIGQKLFILFGETLTAGIITYPLTFLITDVTSEIYGAKRARLMVILGFAMSLLMLILVQVSIALPESPFWNSTLVDGYTEGSSMQNAWVASFGVGWWLVTGSMLAYAIAQLVDVRLFHFFRNLTGGKHLWLRNNGSTLISQLIDTFTVNSFLFYGAFGWDFWTGIRVMFTIYLFKLAIALFDTPLCYLSVSGLKTLLRQPEPTQ